MSNYLCFDNFVKDKWLQFFMRKTVVYAVIWDTPCNSQPIRTDERFEHISRDRKSRNYGRR